MSKLVFAVVWLLVGLVALALVRRRRDLLPGPVRTVAPPALLALAILPPALIFAFSVFRVIPDGHVGVKVVFGQVDPPR